MAKNSSTLPQGSRILVTGANGYIASHVVDKLLGLGYMVRGTVRAPKPWLNEYFQQKYGPNVFETVFVETFGNKDELESIMDGVDGVIHSVRG
jgi:nucleoside-diphosphate-sugar epimerase